MKIILERLSTQEMIDNFDAPGEEAIVQVNSDNDFARLEIDRLYDWIEGLSTYLDEDDEVRIFHDEGFHSDIQELFEGEL